MILAVCIVVVIVFSFALTSYRPYVPEAPGDRGRTPGTGSVATRRRRRRGRGRSSAPLGRIIRGPLNARHQPPIVVSY